MSNNISELRGLWRGKDADEGVWVFGDLLQIPILDNHGKITETKFAIMERTPVAKCRYVDKSTLGECAGLCDKNSAQIFEDDIIKAKEYTFQVNWNDEYAGFYPFFDQDYPIGYGICANICEVIGNIHDNPELLKGGK